MMVVWSGGACERTCAFLELYCEESCSESGSWSWIEFLRVIMLRRKEVPPRLLWMSCSFRVFSSPINARLFWLALSGLTRDLLIIGMLVFMKSLIGHACYFGWTVYQLENDNLECFVNGSMYLLRLSSFPKCMNDTEFSSMLLRLVGYHQTLQTCS